MPILMETPQAPDLDCRAALDGMTVRTLRDATPPGAHERVRRSARDGRWTVSRRRSRPDPGK